MPAAGEHSKITEAERLFASGAGSGRVREELTKKGFTTSARTCERWKASYEKYGSCLKPVKLHGEVGRPLRLNDDEIHVSATQFPDILVLVLTIVQGTG